MIWSNRVRRSLVYKERESIVSQKQNNIWVDYHKQATISVTAAMEVIKTLLLLCCTGVLVSEAAVANSKLAEVTCACLHLCIGCLSL